MASKSSRVLLIVASVPRRTLTILRWIVEPLTAVDEKQRRRLRLLSVFLLLMAADTFAGMIAIKSAGNSIWVVMLATTAILIIGYCLSRTVYYKLATVFAVTIPALPILAAILFSPDREGIPSQLPWLALPLLVCSLLLSLRSTVIVAVSYIFLILLLIPFVDLPIWKLIEPLGFMFMIIFFVVAVNAARHHDQSEIEQQLFEREQAEKALRESEEKFSAAFHSSPLMITITNRKEGKFIDVNDSFVRATGYSREEFIGHAGNEKNIWVEPEELKRMARLMREQGKIRNEEYTLRMKSGEIRKWLCSADIINIGGEPCSIAVAADITERKRAEEALRESEEKFSKIFRSSPVAITINTLKDGVFLEVNDSFTRMSGYTGEEVIGRSSADIKIWADAEDRNRMLQILKKEGRVYTQEFKFRAKSGEIRTWLYSAETTNVGGEPCLIVLSIDITRRKQAEEALRFSDAAFKSIHEAIIATDTELRITQWNDISEQVFGIKATEAIGKKFPDVIEVVESYPGEMQDRLKMLEKQGHREEEELYRTRNREIWVDVHVQEIRANGKLYGRVVLASDITQRKKAEAELKQALFNLEQSSARLAATNKELETFSYSVSHDLRSPLRSIDGFSQVLLEDYNDKLDDTGRDYLGRLRSASQKMGELIDGLLRLSRLTRSEMHLENVDLSALAEEIAGRLQETNPERRVKFVIGGGLTANGDSQLVRVLLENLIGNAWKFTVKTPRAKIEFGIASNGGKQAYYVRDNGAGFDMTYASRLFAAFQRLHDAAEYPGAGIGLATVQRIINRHGGTVWAEGEVGKGATFYFTLN